MQTNIDGTSMCFAFQDETSDGESTRIIRGIRDDEANDLRTVLAKMTEFLQLAGFDYIVALGAEHKDGTMTFSDGQDEYMDLSVEDIAANVSPMSTPFMNSDAVGCAFGD